VQRNSALARPVCIMVAVAGLMTGCGSSNNPAPQPTTPPPAATTAVTLALSSTANDQLTEFDIGLQGISLTSASGRKVSIFSQSRWAEFIHVNGPIVPLVTATIPQDSYTAATVTVGGAAFTCITLGSAGNLIDSTFAYGQTPTADVTITLPSPIVVSGDSMGLTLDMQIGQSASGTCGNPNASYAITPTFTLSAGSSDATIRGVDGQVTALDSDAGGFELTLPNLWYTQPTQPLTLHVRIDSATLWQGVTGFTALHAGTFVDFDGAIQADGSVAASRVAVLDPAAVDVQRGPLLFVSNTAPILYMYPLQQQGKDLRIDTTNANFGNSTFAISAQFSNLQALPFTASFTAANMVPGQNVYISSPTYLTRGSYNALATTTTLMPQTVNGTVSGVSSSGGFTVYSVSLASYDLFPLLATQPGQTTLLSDPGTIEVYVDANTVTATPSAPALGDTLRFYGLVFNDHGTLRMDCAQVLAGASVNAGLSSPTQ
jgi:hypothetical protein